MEAVFGSFVQWIQSERRRIIEDLFTLVRVPSVSDPLSPVKPFGQSCQDALDAMYRLGAGYGFASEDYARTVGRINLNPKPQDPGSVGIWCHLDVVPVPHPEDWVYPPFQGTEIAGRYLIGRGIQDNKMPAIACLHIFRWMREAGISLRKKWFLYLGTSEENGMDDVRWFVEHNPCPDFNLVPDTGFPVCVGQRGSMILEYRIPFPLPNGETLAFHGGSNISVTPEKITASFSSGKELIAEGHGFHIMKADDENAVLNMLSLLAESLPDHRDLLTRAREIFSSVSGMGIHFQDGESGPVLARPTEMDWSSGVLKVRVFCILPLTADPEALRLNAVKAAEKAGIQCVCLRMRPPARFRKDHPLIQVLTDAYREVTDDPAEPFIMTGGNYASLIPNALGYGPGMPGREFPASIFPQGHGDYHQCDESEDWEHIVRFMQVYAAAVIKIDRMAL